MSHLTNIKVLTGLVPVALLDILEEHRHALEAGNPLEYWERVTVTTPASPNTEFLVELATLNRTPVYYLPLKKDKAVDIYTGDTAWSQNKLYLKATVASATITLLVST